MCMRAFAVCVAVARALRRCFCSISWSKWVVTGPLALNRLGDQLVLLPIFNFTYTANQGISLGLLNAATPLGRWLLVAMTAAIAIAVAVWITREKNRLDQIALGMVLGGALGNILDRVRFGFVVDFADLHFGDFAAVPGLQRRRRRNQHRRRDLVAARVPEP